MSEDNKPDVERLRTALLKYGKHVYPCRWTRPRLDCDYGYLAALNTDSKGRALDTAKEPT